MFLEMEGEMAALRGGREKRPAGPPPPKGRVEAGGWRLWMDRAGVGTIYVFFIFLAMPAMPIRPMPIIRIEAGSGTVLTLTIRSS